MIPLVDLRQQYLDLKPDLDSAVLGTMDRGDFILGADVANFEQEFADFCGAAHATSCANGTDALHLACRALNIGPGDEVILPAFTFIATALGPLLAGARPALVDVDPHSGLIDPERVAAAITSRTRALLPVHLYGQMADMEALNSIAKQHGLAVIEDAAQAHGAQRGPRRAGSSATVGCFSFSPGKNLGAYGDGGMLTTDDPAIAERLRRLRNWGSVEKYRHEEFGLNSRLDTLQAAILRIKLRHLASWNARRRNIAGRYDAALKSVPLVRTRYAGTPVFHLYVLRSPARDRILAWLNGNGIGAGIHYPRAVHEHQALAGLKLAEDRYPQAENWARECFSLPLYPEMSDAQVDQVINAVRTSVEAAA